MHFIDYDSIEHIKTSGYNYSEWLTKYTTLILKLIPYHDRLNANNVVSLLNYKSIFH